MMLSRVAERLYWTGRYLERAENTARLVGVYADLTLDLPRQAQLDWFNLVMINDAQSRFESHYRNRDERNVVKFTLGDRHNPGSLLSSLRLTRENVRTTRDTLPEETWEEVNELYLFATEHINDAISKRNRHEYLTRIILACQQLNGMFSSTMMQDSAKDFLRLGRDLERADMTTRILDIGASAQHTADASNPIAELQQVIWLSVLKSVSAYLAYRKLSRVKVSGGRVARFLVEEARFPRTLRYCLNSLVDTIAGLPQATHPHRLAQQIRKRAAAELDYQDLGPAFSNEMDRIQQELAELHVAINHSWFAI